MNKIDLLMTLKNGSDIRGTAIKLSEEDSEITLTDETVRDIAWGFSRYIFEKTGRYKNITIAIGHDSRLSAGRIKKCCIDTFVRAGINVIDCGLCTTPAMYMITIDENFSCDASVMITASHLPADKNGLKFFTKDGGLESSDIDMIITNAAEGRHDIVIGNAIVTKINYLEDYAKHLKNIIVTRTGKKMPLEGMKIAVDAGNGSGGFYAYSVLNALGANIDGSQYLNPDGNFPNHIPNPEHKDAMKSISDAVVTSGSDIGIIFDTDVDRAAIVDRSGRAINKNRLIALISAILLEEKKGTVVTDSVTSSHLKCFIEDILGGCHHRFKRGYKNVINEAIRLNSEGVYCPLAIETSGHAALLENYFLDDGAYLVTRILIKAVEMKNAGKNITDLISQLNDAQIEKSYRLNLLNSDFKSDGNKILADLKNAVEQSMDYTLEEPNYEGVRAKVLDGWFLMRMSLHEPLMPLDIQCDSNDTLNKIIGFLKSFLSHYDSIDISSMK